MGQNRRFWKRDKTADFENGTKPPILKTGQYRPFWKRDNTADFENGTKLPILKTVQHEPFWKRDKTAEFKVIKNRRFVTGRHFSVLGKIKVVQDKSVQA